MKETWFTREPLPHFYGSDRNAQVIEHAKQNAARAGVEQACAFSAQPFSELTRPDGPPGLVIVNPPYGERIGNKKELYGLYGRFGDVMRNQFSGWRVGLMTSDQSLAEATKLPWNPTGPTISHGGLKINLYRTSAL